MDSIAVIDCSGVVEEIELTQKGNHIVVHGKKFALPQKILVVIQPHLRIGVNIECSAKADLQGVIIIINVVKIDNIVIHLDTHKGGDDDEDDQGEDEGD